ncbi:MAG: hypothetical protein AAB363_05865, partial [Planctomycetota bacterium]
YTRTPLPKRGRGQGEEASGDTLRRSFLESFAVPVRQAPLPKPDHLRTPCFPAISPESIAFHGRPKNDPV